MEEKVKKLLEKHKYDKDLTSEKDYIEPGWNWSKTLLEGWDLSGLVLSDYKHKANFQYTTLTNAYLIETSLKGAFLSRAKLQGVKLLRAKLRGADFVGSNLRGANLMGANLQGANLVGSNLRGANLMGANLQGANLGGSNLRDAIFNEKTILAGVNFFQCTLDGSTIKNAYKNIDKEALQIKTIKKNKNYSEAREVYILFKNYFYREGAYDVSGEYYIQEKKMEKILNKKRKKWGKYFLNVFLEIVSGYGERPLNAILCSLIIILLNANIYWLFNGIMTGNDKLMFRGTFFESFYFSLVTFSTLGYGDLIPKTNFFRAVASFESLMGAVLISIFIYIFARKATR